MASGKKLPAWASHVFQQGGISVVRATALTDKKIGRAVGDFKTDEPLPLGWAIIHDKILVMDPVKCAAAFGSHNLGYKASYSNDENLVIVEAHGALAQAYATHVLDLYDHCRFRAAEAELTAQAKKRATGRHDPHWDGVPGNIRRLAGQASHWMSTYFTK